MLDDRASNIWSIMKASEENEEIDVEDLDGSVYSTPSFCRSVVSRRGLKINVRLSALLYDRFLYKR